MIKHKLDKTKKGIQTSIHICIYVWHTYIDTDVPLRRWHTCERGLSAAAHFLAPGSWHSAASTAAAAIGRGRESPNGSLDLHLITITHGRGRESPNGSLDHHLITITQSIELRFRDVHLATRQALGASCSWRRKARNSPPSASKLERCQSLRQRVAALPRHHPRTVW